MGAGNSKQSNELAEAERELAEAKRELAEAEKKYENCMMTALKKKDESIESTKPESIESTKPESTESTKPYVGPGDTWASSYGDYMERRGGRIKKNKKKSPRRKTKKRKN
jgi:hypothetical protein